MDKKYTMSFTKQEILYLESILGHFTDWMAHDDRPDHGLNRLNYYREEMTDKTPIFAIAGKFKRKLRKIADKHSELLKSTNESQISSQKDKLNEQVGK